MIRTFHGLGNFIIFGILLLVIIYVFTSVLYSTLRKSISKETDGEYGGVYFIILSFGITFGVLMYYILRSSFHSLRIDPMGSYYYLLGSRTTLPAIIADVLLATSVLVVTGCWIRIYQILLIEDIDRRFRKLVKLLPYLSIFMTLGLLTIIWFFYSNVFPFYWYFFSFFIIYGIILYFSHKDFLKVLQMRMSRSYEFEEHFSLKTISIIAGILLIILIALPNIFRIDKFAFFVIPIMSVQRVLPFSYIFILFFVLWIVSMYITPGKIFRQLKVFSRFVETPARILFFTRFTRKFLFFWGVIFLFISFVLSSGIMFGPGFSNPYKNVKRCENNLRQIGEAMEQCIEQSHYLPDSKAWIKKTWLSKIKDNRKLKYVPYCPSGGVYEFKKWRDKKGRAMYEIRCSCGAHRRAHIKDNFYPRYMRKKGLIKSSKK
ncbi:MAG: hypothetical protein K8T10_09985 [Candidatus Eremiobacteraeota bacterium]|nr:hypothetical protein [Candidatus Eremiobacteraeota bacterium]